MGARIIPAGSFRPRATFDLRWSAPRPSSGRPRTVCPRAASRARPERPGDRLRAAGSHRVRRTARDAGPRGGRARGGRVCLGPRAEHADSWPVSPRRIARPGGSRARSTRPDPRGPARRARPRPRLGPRPPLDGARAAVDRPSGIAGILWRARPWPTAALAGCAACRGRGPRVIPTGWRLEAAAPAHELSTPAEVRLRVLESLAARGGGRVVSSAGGPGGLALAGILADLGGPAPELITVRFPADAESRLRIVGRLVEAQGARHHVIDPARTDPVAVHVRRRASRRPTASRRPRRRPSLRRASQRARRGGGSILSRPRLPPWRASRGRGACGASLRPPTRSTWTRSARSSSAPSRACR
jgi:hypothetical protein